MTQSNLQRRTKHIAKIISVKLRLNSRYTKFPVIQCEDTVTSKTFKIYNISWDKISRLNLHYNDIIEVEKITPKTRYNIVLAFMENRKPSAKAILKHDFEDIINEIEAA